MSAGRLPAGLLAGALALSACGVSTQSEPERVPQERLPAATPSATAQAAQVRVWVARRERVVPVFVELRGPGLDGRLRALLELSAPGSTLPSAIPAGTRLLEARRTPGDGVELRLTGELRSAGAADLPLALAQLVLTATEDPGVASVAVRSGEQPVRLEGAPDRPLRRADVEVYAQGPTD